MLSFMQLKRRTRVDGQDLALILTVAAFSSIILWGFHLINLLQDPLLPPQVSKFIVRDALHLGHG